MSALYSCLKGKNDAIMAANTSEGTRTVEHEETHEECSGKKKSKFQAFKKLFVKKKRKESTPPSRESNLKPSQSSSDISASAVNPIAFHVDHEPAAKGNMGNKAVSHDSVFISEMESSVKEEISQECTPGKVKALQLQLQQNIRIGSTPQGIVSKKLEDSGTLSEDDGLPRSPPEITSLHEILALSSGKSSVNAQRRSSISLGGTDSEDEPESSELSSRPTKPSHSKILLCPISPIGYFPQADFTSPASSVICLDNSAAKHKILVKPKNRRPPIITVKPTQDMDRTNKPVQMKKKEEKSIMIEEQQPVKILDSEKSSVDHEMPSEEVKNTEGVVLQKPKDNMIVLLCEPQMDGSELHSKNSNTPLLSEASLLENQIMSFQNEAVCSETDVDSHESRVSSGDQVDTAEEDSERDDVTTSPQTCDLQPNHEYNDITVTVKPSEINSDESAESSAVHIEDLTFNPSQDLDCGALTHCEQNLEEAKATAVSEIKDEEYNGHGNLLSDIQNDLLNVTETDLDANDVLQNRMLSTEPVPAMMKDDDVHEDQVAPERVRSYESNEEGHLDTVEVTQNTQVILEVSDQQVANDEGKNKHLPSEQKTETSDRSITVGNDDNTTDSKVPAAITNASDSSYAKVTTSAHECDILANSETSTEIVKEIKVTAPSPGTNVKGSNKPVRFTVAPAWQRALTSGSSVKDSPFVKNVVGNSVRCESFGGEDEAVVQSSNKNDDQKNTEESGGHFGVRLRRTSSSIKYSEGPQEETSRQAFSPLDTSSLHPGRILQTPIRTQVNTDCAKMSKSSSSNEEKCTAETRDQPKPNAEEHSPQENSEPAWITMAKLKKKGFQGQQLAREQISTDENEKVEGTECIQKKNIVPSLQEVEEKKCERAAADSPEEAQPDSEKSTHPTQPQNPDEPPWFSLAKKKAKAWSEMPQIVQQ